MNTTLTLNTKADLEGLPLTLTYVGEVLSPWGDGRTIDQWKITWWTSRAVKQAPTHFYTGLGLRKEVSGRLKPQRPSNADVLYSLFSDSEAEHMPFPDWCVELSYSDDSIKALNTYNECVKIAKFLHSIFDEATFTRIQELLRGH
jgi:hypothetical protein